MEIDLGGNISDKSVVFIEVQTGTYFGEDDIVRIEDDYDRNNLNGKAIIIHKNV